MRPCFCKNGMMSQCIARDYNEQQQCVRFDKSTETTRCMNRNELMDDHCWDFKAQDIGLREAEEEIPLVDLAELFDEEPVVSQKRRRCNDCERFICTKITSLNSKAQGLSAQELWDIASNCVYYRD